MLSCCICARGGLGMEEVSVTECCDSVQCWRCVFEALREGYSSERMFQCLSLSCLRPISEATIRLAAAYQARHLLQAQTPLPTMVELSLESAAGGPKLSLRLPIWTTLGTLTRQALELLGSAEKWPSLQLFLRHRDDSHRYLLSSLKEFQSLDTLEIRDGDTLIVDKDGSVDSLYCPFCDSLVAPREALRFSCREHWMCLDCARVFAEKHSIHLSSTLPCPDALCTGAYKEEKKEKEKAATAPAKAEIGLCLWSEKAMAAPIPGPEDSLKTWLQRCHLATGTNGEDHSALVSDDRGLLLLRPSDKPANASLAIRHKNLHIVPNSLIHKIKFCYSSCYTVLL